MPASRAVADWFGLSPGALHHLDNLLAYTVEIDLTGRGDGLAQLGDEATRAGDADRCCHWRADRCQVEGGGGCIELPAPWLREDFACAEIFPDHIDADIGFSLANLVELVAVNDAFCEGSDDPSQLGVGILIFGHDLVWRAGFDGPDNNRCQLIFNT